MAATKPPLAGRIALVAGATRGAGRGIAVALGEAGATVYCTGRSTRTIPRPAPVPGASPFALEQRPETIEETAELVTRAGGTGIAIPTDHTDDGQVAALAARIAAEQGKLHLLVNDVWGGEELMQWKGPGWDVEPAALRTLLERALLSHVITSRHAVPLLLKGERALLVEITDGDSMAYRGALDYDLVKTAVIRLAFAMAEELRAEGVAAVALTPGFLRSEAMLEHFGVTEETWREAAATDPHFLQSETPLYVGRAVAALAADPKVMRWTGQALSSWGLARAYGFTDADGSRPDWGRHAARRSFGRDQRASHKRFLAAFGKR